MKVHLILVFLLTAVFTEAQASSEKPNILWIVSEDNSPLIGAYGDAFAKTPNIDQLAKEGVLYENAMAVAPVCAASRFTLITGMYASAMGTLHHRSTYQIPAEVQFFPTYLKQAGYYTSNNSKKDYNTVDQPGCWNESSKKATYKNRQPGQPFFAIFNFTTTHESNLHREGNLQLRNDPKKVPVPPYHPRTPEMEEDWALYYDRMQDLDTEVGKVLRELEASGLAENTIVFYYSDHGGALARGKRFMFDSGLRVPLIVRFPKKYAHLAPGKPSSKISQVVSFVDFAPTVLNLAQVKLPSHLQGQPFLGKTNASPRQYAYAYRGRMDERTDMSRSVRDKQYRYIRNYLPHKIYGQHVDYQWKANSMVSWEKAFRAGTLTPAQAIFFQPKPPEELYDVQADPYNLNNLVGQKQFEPVLQRMRAANLAWVKQTKDAGFIPEARLAQINEQLPIADFLRSGNFPLEKVIETADMASTREKKHLKELTKRLQDPEPVVRYWAATGFLVLGQDAAASKKALLPLLQDQEEWVQVAAAEALVRVGETKAVIPVLQNALRSPSQFVKLQALEVVEALGINASPLKPDVQALVGKRSETGGNVALVARHVMKKLEKE